MQSQEAMIKGKRSKRQRPTSPLALTMATSSSTTAEISGGGGVMSDVSRSSDRLTLSPSNSCELTADEEEADMAKCLILLAKGQHGRSSQAPPQLPAEIYQCKTCNKSFQSFQALGGHRASHKKPNKPINVEDKKPLREKHENERNCDDSTILSLQISNKDISSPPSKSRVHECSICGAEFGSGQALGGHMRRHRPLQAAPISSNGESRGVKRPRNVLSLDLNLPAPEDDPHTESKFPFAANEQVIIFSASPLIDCHY